MKPRDTLLALLVVLLWGLNFLFIDLGLRDTLPLVFVALRFAAVAFPLIFFVPKPQASWKVIAGIGLTMSAGQFGLLFTAMHLGLPTGLAPVVLQSQMFFTIGLGALFLREYPNRKQLLGTVLGIVGLVVVGFGRVAAISEGTGLASVLLPLLICIAAGFSWGIGNVISRSASGASGLGLVVHSALWVPLPMVGLSLLLDGPAAVGDAFTTLGPETWWGVAFTAVMASLVGYSIWNTLLGKYPTAKVVPYTLLIPAIGMGSAAIVLGQYPNALELMGALILVAGVGVGTLTLRRKRGNAVVPEMEASPSPVPVRGRSHKSKR
ncbi:EamA family transporter [Arthrobacter sp. MYb227]|uniref:EamA family transporter n=1 Tax=Arthrobacter sp. MYb227 TaxID=1848601 RepID=UPI000CFE3123|nr:EamA family transporter [Arthrobacter sp. MYb227]PQZ86715.1 EamA family transporter [Arthrobacter sp. MYb227]